MRVGACQTPEILGDVGAAVRLVHDFAARATAAAVDLLLFPECYLQGYLVTDEHVHGHAVETGSPEFAEVLAGLAGIRQVLVVGMIERSGDTYFNTAVVLRGGRLLGLRHPVRPGGGRGRRGRGAVDRAVGNRMSAVRPQGRIGRMKVHERIGGRLRAFIEAQPMFFVATAPSGAGGHVNVSPKGMAGTFVVLGEHRVAYLDYHGSGAETIAHLNENGRITLMFCAFQGPPNIVRLHGHGRAVPVTSPEYPDLLRWFGSPPDTHGVRSVIDVAVERVSDSCGYAVPFMSYEGDRDLLVRAHERRTEADLADYRRVKNGVSIDGRPIFADAGPPEG
jgi:hypothetical protein